MGNLPVIGQAVTVPVHTDGAVDGLLAVDVHIFQLVVVNLTRRDVFILKGVLPSHNRRAQTGNHFVREPGEGTPGAPGSIEMKAHVVQFLGRLPFHQNRA